VLRTFDCPENYIKQLKIDCAFSLEGSYENLPYLVYSQNCKYFDILTRKPIFNVLRLIGIQYQFINDEFVIIENHSRYLELKPKSRIININGANPWTGLSDFQNTYELLYVDSQENQKKLRIQYPDIGAKGTSSKFLQNKFIENGHEVLVKLSNFKEIDFITYEKLYGKYLWFDLRGNQGGDISNLVSLLDNFRAKGEPIFYLRKQEKLFKILSKNSCEIKPKKIYILVNKKTASAAEMLAKKLRDSNSAVIIGGETEGKWLTNSIRRFDNYFIKFPEYLFSTNEEENLIIGEGIEPNMRISDIAINKFLCKKFNLDKTFYENYPPCVENDNED